MAEIIEGLDALKFILLDMGVDEKRVNSVSTLKDGERMLEYMQNKKENEALPKDEKKNQGKPKLVENAGKPPSELDGGDDVPVAKFNGWNNEDRVNHDKTWLFKNSVPGFFPDPRTGEWRRP